MVLREKKITECVTFPVVSKCGRIKKKKKLSKSEDISRKRRYKDSLISRNYNSKN